MPLAATGESLNAQYYTKSPEGHGSSLRYSYAAIVRRCGETKSLQEGRSIHREISLSPQLSTDVFLLNLLIQMYGKCGSVAEARSCFDLMPYKNVFSWNILIAAYAQNGHPEQALGLFWEMRCLPSKITFVSVLAACAALGDAAELEAVHKKMIQCLSATIELDRELVLGTALVTAYAKCGSLESASSVFSRLESRDSVSFNAVIAAAAQHGDFAQALQFFRAMQLGGVRATSATILSFAAACSDPALAAGIHQRALDIGLGNDLNTMNSLVTMYGNCASLASSWDVFRSIRSKDVISWNAMIGALVQCGEAAQAIHLSRAMDLEGIKFVEVTFLLVLGACCRRESLDDGKRIHDRAARAGCDENPVLASAIVSMYGRCGSIDRATEFFARMRDPGVVSFNSMLSQLVQHGRAAEALDLFFQRMEGAIQPNKVTYVNLVEACAMIERVEDGRRIHRSIAAQDLDTDLVLGSLLVNMYGSCGSVDEARSAFARIKPSSGASAIAWNAMVGALALNDRSREALGLICHMDCEGVRADEVSFISLLGACEDLGEGRRLHDRLVSSGFDRDIVAATAVVSTYSRCGAIDRAKNAFDRIQKKDLVAWNAIIAGHAQNGHLEQATALVARMEMEGMRANESVMGALAASCQNSAQARRIHGFVACCYMEDMDCYEAIGVALIHMFAKAGCASDARGVFDSMKKSSLAPWNSMLGAYAQLGHSHCREAELLLAEISLQGLDPDEITFSYLLNAFAHSGRLDRAREIFVDMVGEFGIAATGEHYGCMIHLLGRCGRLPQAQELVDAMPFEPDSMGWTSLLSASSIHSHLAIAEQSARFAAALDPANSAPYVLLSNVIRDEKISM